MKSRFIEKTLVSFLTLMVFFGCQKEIEAPSIQSPSGGPQKTFRLSFLPKDKMVVTTKSNYITESINFLQKNNIYLRIYWGDILVYDLSNAANTWNGSSSTDVYDIDLNLNAKYTIFAWNDPAEAGGNFSKASKDALIASYFEFLDSEMEWEDMGMMWDVPMTFYAENIDPVELDALDGSEDDFIVIPMEYLFAKVNLSIEYDDLVQTMYPTSGSYGVSVLGVLAGGMNQKVGLFSPDANSRCTSSVDVTMFQGDNYTWYFPESLGGNILPNNTDPFQKSAENLEALGYDTESFPYLQVRLRFYNEFFTSPSTKTYRFYLGENSYSNFDLRRNHEYNVTLHIGYDGLDITGSWKIDGARGNDNRFLAMEYYNKSYAAPGESIVFQSYLRIEGTRYDNYFGASNGFFVFNNSAAVDTYIEGGTPAISQTVQSPALGASYYWLICNKCKHVYYDMPKTASSRTTWRNNNLTVSGLNVYCKWCGQLLWETAGSGDFPLYNGGNTGTGTNITIISNPNYSGSVSYLCYTVPSTASSGSTVTLYGSTKDGLKQNVLNIPVRTSGSITLSHQRNYMNYVGQVEKITPSNWATGTYGSNPTLTYSISCTNPAGVADASVAYLSTSSTGTGSQVTSASASASSGIYVYCRKSGSYTVTCKYGSTTLGTITGTIQYPSIGYPTGANSSDKVIVPLYGNGSGTMYEPVFIVRAGTSSNWIEYTDYNASLKSTWLGNVTRTTVDNSGWVYLDSGSTSGQVSLYLDHAYKNGTVSDSNLLPFRNPSTRIELYRYTASSSNIRTNGIAAYDIPVYFTDIYQNIIANVYNATYTKWEADSEDITGTNPSRALPLSNYFNVQAYGINLRNGFRSSINGNNFNIIEGKILKHQGSGQYWFMIDDMNIGLNELKWQIKGRSDTDSNAYILPLARFTLKKYYVGKIFSQITRGENNYGKNTVNEFFMSDWDGDSQRYPRSHYPTLNEYSFEETFIMNYVPSGLFTVSHLDPLPTTGLYDPKDLCDGKDDSSSFPMIGFVAGVLTFPVNLIPLAGILATAYMSNKLDEVYMDKIKDEVFYFNASHDYSTTNGYSIRLNRWYIFESFHLLGNGASACELWGFGPNKYRQFNSPLFCPATSPQTINGIVWNKVSDDGTTATWLTADGYQSCTFKYGAWE